MTGESSGAGAVRPGPIAVTTTVPSPTIAIRSYFSTHFLAAAHDAADKARAFEANRDRPHFSLEHRGLVLSAIVHSVTFMEAAINEVLQDAAEARANAKINSVLPEVVRAWAGLWQAFDEGYGGNTLKRFQAALVVASMESFDVGREPWQSAVMLVRLRNHLVHFRPETVSADDPQRLVRGLSSKVERNPLSSNAFDLDGWLSASCAHWAVASAEAFVGEFANRTGARPNYLRMFKVDAELQVC